jgi:hypothetical protein
MNREVAAGGPEVLSPGPDRFDRCVPMVRRVGVADLVALVLRCS